MIDLIQPLDWQASAACLDVEPDLFFPERGQGYKYAEARAVCGSCPVRATCLEWAIESGEEFGIFGGLDETERRKLRRNQGRKSRAKEAIA